MRIVLDEMWSPAIAVELRNGSFDAIAITEAEHAGRYAGVADEIVFARAQEDGRTIVTHNVPDFENVRLAWEARGGGTHNGLIYALNPPFNRHRGNAVIGQMVRALDRFLHSAEAQADPFNRVHFLREARSDE